jgi:transcriptional regulator NrdR family protein
MSEVDITDNQVRVSSDRITKEWNSWNTIEDIEETVCSICGVLGKNNIEERRYSIEVKIEEGSIKIVDTGSGREQLLLSWSMVELLESDKRAIICFKAIKKSYNNPKDFIQEISRMDFPSVEENIYM